MPLYEYSCLSCDTRFEARRSADEAGSPTSCPACGGTARRVYTAPPVIFRPPGYSLPPGHPDYWKDFAAPRVHHGWQDGWGRRNRDTEDRAAN